MVSPPPPPQGFVIMVTMLRELYDDIKRHMRDREVNSQRYYRLTPQGSLCTSSSIGVNQQCVSSTFPLSGRSVPPSLSLVDQFHLPSLWSISSTPSLSLVDQFHTFPLSSRSVPHLPSLWPTSSIPSLSLVDQFHLPSLWSISSTPSLSLVDHFHLPSLWPTSSTPSLSLVGQFHTFPLSTGRMAVTSSNIQVSDILVVEKVKLHTILALP